MFFLLTDLIQDCDNDLNINLLYPSYFTGSVLFSYTMVIVQLPVHHFSSGWVDRRLFLEIQAGITDDDPDCKPHCH